MVAVLTRLPPALARTDLALDDDGSAVVHHTGAKEWKQREDGRGRVAARARDTRGATDLVPVELGDAVGPAVEQCRPRVRRAIATDVVCWVALACIDSMVDQNRSEDFVLVARDTTVQHYGYTIYRDIPVV